MTPRVSVVTATRNRTDLLAQALRSVQAQTFPDFETIIVDDGSDLEVLEFQRALRRSLDERFVFVEPVAPGVPGTTPSRARNRGIWRSRGKYEAFLDDDDEWSVTDHLSVAVEMMERHEGDYYFGNMCGYRDGRVIQPDWFFEARRLARGPRLGSDPEVFEVPLPNMAGVLRHHVVHPSSSVIRRSLLEGIGGFVEGLTGHEDVNLMMRLADRATRILYRPDVVANYRFPTGNAHSLEVSQLMQVLHKIALAAHVRTTCEKPLVRHYGRSWQAWSLRELACLLDHKGARWEALRYRWEALCVFATLGTLRELVQTVAGIVLRRKGGGKGD